MSTTKRKPSSSSPSTGSSHNTRAGREPPTAQDRSMELPEQLRGEEEEEDVDESSGGADGQGLPMQQSVYGMIAATTSRANFKFEQDSGSESESENVAIGGVNKVSSTGSRRDGKRSSLDKARQQPQIKPGSLASQHRKRLSEKSLARSFLKPARNRKDSQAHDPMTQSQFLPPRKEMEDGKEDPAAKLEALRNDAPMLDLKMQAMARAGKNLSSTSLHSKVEKESGIIQQIKPPKSLPRVIADIFNFPEPEEIVAEYPCWYLQNVLLQGFMYITQKHVCFYAYLKKKTNFTIKTGHLGKLGKHSYRYGRYWFKLKGDIFCYYKSEAEPYFPVGLVDLRYAVSADVTEKEGTDFTITTHDRTYQYRAETAAGAKEWVKQLQKVIFRSHNDGDSVKISLPINSIRDVEKAGVVDFAETVRLRVEDDDETFSIDEYFFTFFESGEDAWDVLKVLTDGNNSAKHAAAMYSEDGEHILRKAQSSKSKDTGGRTSFDREQRSLSRRSVSKSPRSASVQESSECYVTSGDEMDASMSASQMLSDDGLFGGPTLRMPHRQRTASGASKDRVRKRSSQRSTSRDSSAELPPKQSSGHGRHTGRPELEPRSSAGSGRTIEAEPSKAPPSDTTASGRVIRGISAPLQNVFAVAGMVRTSSQRMGSYLSSSPKDYIWRFSGAITGGKKHYSDVEGLAPDDSVRELESEGDIENDQLRFQAHFGLPYTEKLDSTFFCWLHKTVPLYGKVYMSQRRFCFRSLWYGTKIKLVISFKDIVTVHKQRGFRWGYSGMVLVIKGHEELFLEFGSAGLRDDCAITVLRSLENGSHNMESTILDEEELEMAEAAAAENEELQAARKNSYDSQESQLPRSVQQTARDAPPMLFDDSGAEVFDLKLKKPMKIVCLTIGSRGDVQPYIALCKGFIAQGHHAKIATHKEFGPWVEKHGIEFAEVEGDPADLMRICVENGMFTPSFFLEANSKFRVWLDGLLVSSYEACKGADLLIESPSAMCGIHIAEKLQVPYFRAFTMPWTRTRAYPHAFSVPNSKKGGAYNYMTYTLFDNVFWIAISGQINRWRGKTMGLMPTSLDRLQQNKVPFLYNFSPNVVVPPLDFSDWIKVTGYWFLDEGETYTPPSDLQNFIKKAREDNVKLVYIGFGSVTVADSKQLMQCVMDAVQKADVRCILSKGWSDRFDAKDPANPAVSELPSYIHQICSAPHDWLFAQVDAVVHHGGAGTTGASLRAGVPTIIKPFFGDQYFFATRVEDLGVGIQLKGKISSLKLGKALWIATHDARMQRKAKELGELIRAEDGVGNAINEVWRGLDYAKGLVKMRAKGGGEDEGATEENWTFVEVEGEDGGKEEVEEFDPAPATSGVSATAAAPAVGAKK